jgi:hypothetical protein
MSKPTDTELEYAAGCLAASMVALRGDPRSCRPTPYQPAHERVEPVSPDPIPFLRTRLNEDAKIARSVTDQQAPETLGAVLTIDQPDVTPASVRAIAVHVVRWDPARVLAEVAAKRRIIELCEGLIEAGQIDPSPALIDDAKGADVAEQVLEIMTQAYVEHPDYDPTWGEVR